MRARRQGGFSLLEVMIALVILSIGLLGLAGLQGTGLRTNHEAYLRSQATLLAYDIVERMRANREPALGGDYVIAIGATPSGPSVADTDLIEWRAMLSEALPSGTGAVTTASDGTVVVTVQWDDSRGENPPFQFSMETQL